MTGEFDSPGRRALASAWQPPLRQRSSAVLGHTEREHRRWDHSEVVGVLLVPPVRQGSAPVDGAYDSRWGDREGLDAPARDASGGEVGHIPWGASWLLVPRESNQAAAAPRWVKGESESEEVDMRWRRRIQTGWAVRCLHAGHSRGGGSDILQGRWDRAGSAALRRGGDDPIETTTRYRAPGSQQEDREGGEAAESVAAVVVDGQQQPTAAGGAGAAAQLRGGTAEKGEEEDGGGRRWRGYRDVKKRTAEGEEQ
jgi:hypothetical protein